MPKSKNWKAVVADTLISSDLTLTVSGKINTGGSHHAVLRKKIPQGIAKNHLVLEAEPISDVFPEIFVPVSYKEKLSDGRIQYTSILILVEGNDEELSNITKIDQHIS